MTVGDFWRLEVLPTLARTWTPELQWPGSRWTRHGDAWRGCCPLHGGDNPTGFEISPARRTLALEMLDPMRLRTCWPVWLRDHPRGAEFRPGSPSGCRTCWSGTAPIDSAERQTGELPARRPRSPLRCPRDARRPGADLEPRTRPGALLERFQAALRVPGNHSGQYLEQSRHPPGPWPWNGEAGYAEPGTWPVGPGGGDAWFCPIAITTG